MKTWKKIFIGLVAVMLVSPVVADDNCQDDDYLYVVPELALCSTHAYNGGFSSNEGLSVEDKNHMNHVIALKSTIISQQMYKQYETLDKLIKKLKTQLEKAVLTTRLEAAGAKSDGSSSGGASSGFSSNDRNVFMAGVKNCNTEMLPSSVFSCLYSNYTTIYNTSGNGTKITNDLKKQLANDYKVACGTYFTTNNKPTACDDESCQSDTPTSWSKETFRKCLDGLIMVVRQGMAETQKSNSKNQMMNQLFGG